MEWVKVTYPIDCAVFVDKRKRSSGRTNRKFSVGEGTHRFQLDDPDCEPASVEYTVVGTSEFRPLVIDDFHQTDAT